MYTRAERTIAVAGVLAVATLLLASTGRADDPKPYVDVTTISVTTNVDVARAAAPEGRGAAQAEVCNWTPRVCFVVHGPLPAGSAVFVEFSRPDGGRWLRLECETPELDEGRSAACDTVGPRGTGRVMYDAFGLPRRSEGGPAVGGKGIAQTGICPFRIRYKSELSNTEGTLFEGKVKIAKLPAADGVQPNRAKQFIYYADLDWRLPIGLLHGGFDPTYGIEAALRAQVWFAGRVDSSQVIGYLFLNGKQIACTAKEGEGRVTGAALGWVAREPARCDYSCETIEFGRILVSGNGPTEYINGVPISRRHELAKNPGEYEIKVLLNKHLVRSAKFTVGPDGKIVDNGLAQKANLGTNKMLLPVQVLGNEDGQWDKDAYKTQAFWFNPVDGFVAPQ
jgi:hypothetical protein